MNKPKLFAVRPLRHCVTSLDTEIINEYLKQGIDSLEQQLIDGSHFEYNGKQWTLYDVEGHDVRSGRTLSALLMDIGVTT